MHRKDDLLLAEAYELTKQIDEGLLDRTSSRWAGAKATLGGLKDRAVGYGQALKGVGQALTGNVSGAKDTIVAANDKIQGAKNAGLIAKMNTLVKRKATDIVNDINSLGINSKTSPLEVNELIRNINQILVNKGISPKELTTPVSTPVQNSSDEDININNVNRTEPPPLPAATSLETPAAETSVETPTETPVETPTETPVETPTETPVETPTETPTETPVETIETPTSTTTSVENKKPSISARIKEIEDTIKAEGDKSGSAQKELVRMKKIQKQMQTGKRQKGIKKQDIDSYSESFSAYFKSKFIIE